MLEIDIYGDDDFEIKVMRILLDCVITPFFNSPSYKNFLSQRKEKPWTKKSEASKKPSRKIPPKKKRSLKTLKKPIRSVTKSATTAKK